MQSLTGLLALLLLFATVGCDLTSEASEGPAGLVIGPDTLLLADSSSARLTVRDESGQQIDPARVTFVSGNPAVATVSADGMVSAMAAGTTTVQGTLGRATDTLVVAVRPIARTLRLEVDSVVVAERPVTWTARVLDRQGKGYPNAQVRFEIRQEYVGQPIHAATVVTDTAGYARTLATVPFGDPVTVVVRTASPEPVDSASRTVLVRAQAHLSPGSLVVVGPSCAAYATVTGTTTGGHFGGRVPSFSVADTTIAVLRGIPQSGGTTGRFGRAIWGRSPGKTYAVASYDGTADSTEVTVVAPSTPAQQVPLIPVSPLEPVWDAPDSVVVAVGDTASVAVATSWRSCDATLLPVGYRISIESETPGSVRVESSESRLQGQVLTTSARVRALVPGRFQVTGTAPYGSPVKLRVIVR